jgi:chromosome segregation protein
MSALSEKLEVAQARLADLARQQARLEEDRTDADRLTRDAVEALARLSRDLEAGRKALAEAEAARPALAAKSEDTERASRMAELALAKATADQAGVEAEWRVAEAAVDQARGRLERLTREAERIERLRGEIAASSAAGAEVAAAGDAVAAAGRDLTALRARLEADQARKAELQSQRDDAAAQLATARAELAGVEREHTALARDREARAKREASRQGLPAALDKVSVAPGYERALAAALGRDGKAPLGAPAAAQDGRFWTGAAKREAVADSLLAKLKDCPPELAARLALVHCADDDDGRLLAPGEWLVTRVGHLRRWDGFVARGEGAAEAAQLEAANRFSELNAALPPLRAAADEAEALDKAVREELTALQTSLIAQERAIAAAIETERQALRRLDAAEAARERLAARAAELATSAGDVGEQVRVAESEITAAEAQRDTLPARDAGRAALEAAQAKNEAARTGLQTALAALAAQDQALAVTRERLAAQQSDHASWQARSSEATRRMADAAQRLAEIAEERAVYEAKPAALIAEIEAGEATRARLGSELAEAEAARRACEDAERLAANTLAQRTEALAQTREARATLVAQAENQELRRTEMARISGERFQCPPPLLTERFGFVDSDLREAAAESEDLEKLTAARERIGPVNLVAADELARIESELGGNALEQAELTEAIARLRGSIGSLNREGRERLRAAFEEVDGHFRVLFTRLFEGGQAHLALVDSDDPLEAGLEIYAQPPGKRLQSLSLLSGGEQALTATALIFALFLTNPAPICVLDEVDAPLDDANVERFCDLLDSMVRTTATRYLIVTHNAVTMSRMHRLFGVTMAEKGVSRLVSVDLGEASLLAAE